jgi:hypothetical protein
MGVAGGQIETAGKFFEPSEEESERMAAGTTRRTRHVPPSLLTQTPFWACARSSLRPRTPTLVKMDRRGDDNNDKDTREQRKSLISQRRRNTGGNDVEHKVGQEAEREHEDSEGHDLIVKSSSHSRTVTR